MDALRPLNVLVVESEAGMSMLIQVLLHDLRHDVIGPVARPDQAMRFALQAECDIAILEISDRNSNVYSLADVLRFRKLPLIFTANDDANPVPQRFQDCLVLSKPFSREAFSEAVASTQRVQCDRRLPRVELINPRRRGH